MARIDRTKNATRNIVFGSILKIYQIIVPFIMRTAMIYFMGVQYLGLNSLFTSILQVLNLAELGVGSAMIYSMYKPIAEDNNAAICALMKLYRTYYRVIGLIIAVAGCALTPFIPKLISGDVPEEVNIYVLYLLNLGATVLSYWLYAYKNSILQAYQRMDVVSKVALVTSTIQYVFQLLVLWLFKNYYYYMGYLISLGIYSFKGVKVGLDCANGASWNIAKSVFDALGADTYVINNKPNGLNINNNAGSTHIEGLQKFVVENGLDVGFAFDGDADRCLCVDEKGNVITGDHILYIYGCYMKERGKLLTNTVVTTVMSNFGLYKAFDEQGIGYAKTAVGDKYVYEYMAKNGCRIGGEQSGHIIFSKYASTGDGILTSLKMMEVMLAKKLPMSKLAEPLKIYPQVLENVRVTDKKAAQNDPAVQEAVKAVAEALGDTGRILVRESGTEPVVRVMVEAPDHDTCQKYVSQVVEVIKAKGYVV